MATPTDNYPSLKLSKLDARPKGMAKFNEPVFKQGVFQNTYIEVEVMVYDKIIEHPDTGQVMMPVRFGEMDVVRFVDVTLLGPIVPF